MIEGVELVLVTHSVYVQNSLFIKKLLDLKQIELVVPEGILELVSVDILVIFGSHELFICKPNNIMLLNEYPQFHLNLNQLINQGQTHFVNQKLILVRVLIIDCLLIDLSNDNFGLNNVHSLLNGNDGFLDFFLVGMYKWVFRGSKFVYYLVELADFYLVITQSGVHHLLRHLLKISTKPALLIYTEDIAESSNHRILFLHFY